MPTTTRAGRTVILALLAALTAAFVLAPAAPASAAAKPVVSFVGDSYTAGWGATVCTSPKTDAGAWYRYTAADLGWTVGSVNATPGAGFVRKGTGGRDFYAALKAKPIAATSTYVVLAGGYNDRKESPAAAAAGAKKVLALIRAQAPKAQVVFVSALLPADRVTTNYVKVARAISAPAAIGTTRHASAFMLEFPTCADGTHPSAAGHKKIGAWVASRIKNGFDNAPGFRKNAAGTSWVH